MLDMTRSQPGLIDEAGAVGRVLALEGVLAVGRSDETAFSAESLISCELRGNRVIATYRPIGWSELEVQATWTAQSDIAVGLEVQIVTRSVGELKQLEVTVAADWKGQTGLFETIGITPRDALSAQMSYDGRMRDLEHVMTESFAASQNPVRWWMSSTSPMDDPKFVSMFFGEDVSRCITLPSDQETGQRYCCFGHDLERGVVLRARIRGLWLPDDGIATRAEAEALAFANEPLPLGT